MRCGGDGGGGGGTTAALAVVELGGGLCASNKSVGVLERARTTASAFSNFPAHLSEAGKLPRKRRCYDDFATTPSHHPVAVAPFCGPTPPPVTSIYLTRARISDVMTSKENSMWKEGESERARDRERGKREKEKKRKDSVFLPRYLAKPAKRDREVDATAGKTTADALVLAELRCGVWRRWIHHPVSDRAEILIAFNGESR